MYVESMSLWSLIPHEADMHAHTHIGTVCTYIMWTSPTVNCVSCYKNSV